MHRYYVAVGDRENWKSAFAKGNVWGFSDGRSGIYSKIRVNDRVFFYVKMPVAGIIGLGRVVRKFRDSAPFFFRDWTPQSDWPWRFEFEVMWPDQNDLFGRTVAVGDLINPRASGQWVPSSKAVSILQRCDPNLKY